MVSDLHEILVELFRQRGELAPALLQACARLAVPHDHVELTSIDLSQVVPTQYRADAVVELRGRGRTPVAAVIVEVQLDRDKDKPYAWPVYVTALRAKLRAQVTLLVVAPRRSIAAWARRSIEIGHPGFALRPVVISFEDLPRITDPARAQALPELAVLSTMAHRDLEVATVAVEAIAGLPSDQNRLYLDIILANLPDRLRRALEARMKNYQYKSEFARTYYGQGHTEGREEGRTEGREEGRTEGREEGRTEGREEGLQEALLALAHVKLKALSADDEAALRALHDRDVLTKLIRALARASTAAAARAAFAAAVRRAGGK